MCVRRSPRRDAVQNGHFESTGIGLQLAVPKGASQAISGGRKMLLALFQLHTIPGEMMFFL